MRKYLLFSCIFILVVVEIFQIDLGLAADKFSHLKVSLLLFTLIFAARLTFRKHSSEAVALVLALRDTLFIGFSKELLDGALGTGVAELADLIADLFGIAIPFLGILLAEFFEIGRESLVHSGSRKIIKNEKNYFKKQIKLLRHSGLKLIYQI
jgi:signal transduction histidine kinase